MERWSELLPFVVLSAPVFAITAVLFMKFLAAAVDKLGAIVRDIYLAVSHSRTLSADY